MKPTFKTINVKGTYVQVPVYGPQKTSIIEKTLSAMTGSTSKLFPAIAILVGTGIAAYMIG